MTTYEPGKYHNYGEVQSMLSNWAASHPGLCSLESIGKALDGKDLWMLTLTDASTGKAEDKPAMWCDGNTHAGEVTGCQACLHLINQIVEKWDADDTWTKDVMATSALYVLPRVSPDGAECKNYDSCISSLTMHCWA